MSIEYTKQAPPNGDWCTGCQPDPIGPDDMVPCSGCRPGEGDNDLHLEKPPIELVIRETGWQPWDELFARWHYLHGIGHMAFSTAYTGYVGDTPACFIGMSAMVAGRTRVARACRMVVLPEWMGAGIGTNFLDYMAERELKGEGFVGKPVPTIFHTAHPALCAVLRHKKDWRQVSAKLFGEKSDPDAKLNWGGHFRAVAGFKYYGQAGIEAADQKERT